MGTVANVVIGLAQLSIKSPYTEAAWTDLGYTEKGVDQSYAASYKTGPPPSFNPWPVDSVLAENQVLFSMRLMEATIANLKAVLVGYSTSLSTSTSIVLGESTGSHYMLGFRIIGTGPSGAIRTITVPFGRAEGPVMTSFGKIEGQFPHLVIRVFDNGTDDPYTLEDS